VTGDKWTQWLLTGRDGDHAGLRARQTPGLAAMRDGVLGRAGLRPGDVLLDVGAGTGLIGLGALSRLGPDGRVIFSDVSADLLEVCRRAAGDDDRCGFVQASAEDLAGIPDASVDVVTVRSVLIYLSRKEAAFAAFRRVLRPGGRLSLFEPINRFPLEQRTGEMFGVCNSPVDDLLAKVREAFPVEDVMMDFDERDLLRFAVDAGFDAVELDYRAQRDVPAEPITDWAALTRTAPNPLVPTYGEVIAATLTEAEARRLDEYMNALVAAGTPTRRTMAVAFLRASVPEG
jgi:arsenite methyltransferase